MVEEPLLGSFHIVKRIGTGGFSIVDEGVDLDGESVAIKKEFTSDKVTRPFLEHEYHVYKLLSAGHPCIANIKAYGRQGRFNILVMDLLGPSLSDRFRECGNQFSLKTTVRLAQGMLNAIKYVHSRGFIHRDIKPGNFVLGRGAKSHVVYLVDFGLARRWTGNSVNEQSDSDSYSSFEKANVLGTPDFVSLHTHLGKVHTRRDDLYALAYTVLLFARGNLPWQSIRGSSKKHRARRLVEKKRSWNAARLCQGLPVELEEFSRYCFSLAADEEPDYDFLHDKLAGLANRQEWTKDLQFEWDEPDWKLNVTTPQLRPSDKMRLPAVHIKRGDVVLLRLHPEKTLDFEPTPRQIDSSFLGHQPLSNHAFPLIHNHQPPYRPAVVSKVITKEQDPDYFQLEVYCVLRRTTGLSGLSSRRTERCFRQVDWEAFVKNNLDETNGFLMPASSGDGIYVYHNPFNSAMQFKIEYKQGGTITPSLSIPESLLSKLENEFADAKLSYWAPYESDDEDTRAMQQNIPRCRDLYICVMDVEACCYADLSLLGDESTATNATLTDMEAQPRVIDTSGTCGWNCEIFDVDRVMREENDERDSWSEEEDEDDLLFWEFPYAVDRRLSCTVSIPVASESEGLGASLPGASSDKSE